jgi:hypothetical protein
MPGGTLSRGGPDRARIKVKQAYELREWAERFGVSPREVREAVRTVGDHADRVEALLASRVAASPSRGGPNN